ncbi:MAG: hypothetical protein HYT64_02745 [Candidatus Yanofskybacteria bacterium]|nr:hypothetical protein [Candidatus Yanofskybacteria bacterium]
MSCDRIMRQFYVSKDTGLTISQAETKFGVEVRSMTIDDTSDKLYHRRLISVEGNHDDVYRLFDVLCPGTLRPEQRKVLGLE